MVFYVFGGIQIVGAFQFILFATSEPQPWGVIEETPNPKNGDIEMNDKMANQSTDQSVNQNQLVV